MRWNTSLLRIVSKVLQERPWPQGLSQILSVETPFCLVTAASKLSVENILSPSTPKITWYKMATTHIMPPVDFMEPAWFLNQTARGGFDTGEWAIRCCCICSPGTSAWIKAGAYLLGEWTSTAAIQWELAACNISSLVSRSCWETKLKKRKEVSYAAISRKQFVLLFKI